jgi:hypothetical protein
VRPPGIMRKVVSITTVAIVVALAAAGSAAAFGAIGNSKAAPVCSNETVEVAHVGKLTIRFGLMGRVSCGEAHRVIRKYFHEMSAGHCGALNNFCDLALSGGWDCSIFPAAEEKETGGAFAGCYRMTTGGRIRLYKAKRPISKSHASRLHEFNALSGTNPPCTRQALTAGLHRSKLRGRRRLNSWGCAGRFAYGGVEVFTKSGLGIETTVLFRADARGWEVVSRGKYCENGAVPARIRQPACETN